MKSNTWFRFQHRYAPYIFLLPFALSFLAFLLYPLTQSLLLSFYKTYGPKQSVFVGLDNFKFLLFDADFHKAAWNTIVFAFFSVFFQLPLSLGLALLLNWPLLKFRNAWRFSFFSPYLLGQVFTAILFGVIFAPHFGLFNVLLNDLFGADIARRWLMEKHLIMPAIVLTALWMYVGFNMIYFLAALQNVNRDLYDAAAVDGAGAWQRFRHVTLPGIKPVAVFVVVLSTIGSFQIFELPYLLLQNTSGTDQAGLTVVMYLYQTGFESGDLGYASVVGWSLALGVLLLAVFQMMLSGTWKKDDA